MENISEKEKLEYDFVFVVLVYRNVQDLQDFFNSLRIDNSRVIVVNSYYDNTSTDEFKKIADENNADFLSVPNKGYGAGNNRGCEYALRHYIFKYLVVSNADITIASLNIKALSDYSDGIIAPNIQNKSGRKQNPANPFKSPLWYSNFMYWIFRTNRRKLLVLCSIYSRFTKTIFLVLHNLFNKRRIFAAHGAFLIVPYSILERLFPMYDEKMFLFCEEPHLGMLCKSRGIRTYYVPEVVIHHKEDGSMSIANVDTFELTKNSFNVYYDNWIRQSVSISASEKK